MKKNIFVLRRSRLILLAGILAASAILAAVSSPSIVGAAAAKRLLPIYCVSRDNKAAALTFDAAWGNVIYGTYN